MFEIAKKVNGQTFVNFSKITVFRSRLHRAS